MLDAEEQNRSLIELFDACAAVVQEHRGSLVAAFGEQALFFFGYPQADEQDGERAARAALALRAAMATESERLQQRGIELAARTGIHSGLVVAPSSLDALDASLTIGLTPTLTARIAERSSPGTIVVSDVVQRILRLSFDLEAQGALDDSFEPIKLFLLQGEPTGGAASAPSEASAPPLVGREPEVMLLVQRWEQARQGTGQCVLISGEPGIGKSRLARALLERIEEGPHFFLSLRCSPDAQNSPLLPVIDVIERMLDQESDDAHAGKLARLESLLSRHGLDPSTNVPLMAALLSVPLGDRYPALDMSPELQKKRTLEAIRALLFAMTEARPIFMLVEDLHWADPTTLELLGRVSSAPVYIVLTARPELSQTSLPAAGDLQISLSRLGSDDIEALVAELVGTRNLPKEALRQIIQRTDGLPLFVEELAQMLIESGVLLLRDDSYELARPLRDSDLPSSLQDLLTSRLDRLGKAKETAQLAATLGRELGLALLSAASERGPEDVQTDLEELRAAGLIQAKRRGDDKIYVFRHALIRDAAYASMPLAARRNVHARVAKTLEEKFASIAEARPDLLAQHHAGAASYARAVQYGTRAAQIALDHSNNDEAMAQSALVIGWLPELDQETRVTAELELRSIKLCALMSKEGWASPNVRAFAEESRALCSKTEDTQHRASILFALFVHYHFANERAACRTAAEELKEFAEATNDDSSRAWAALAQGVCGFTDGHMAQAERWLARSLELCDTARDLRSAAIFGLDCRSWATAQLAQVQCSIGQIERAVSLGEEIIAWARKINNTPALGIGLLYLGQIYQELGNRDASLRCSTELLKLAAQVVLPAYEGYAAALVSWANRDRDGIVAIINGLRSTNRCLALCYYTSLLADIEAKDGNLPPAIAHIANSLEMCEQFDERWYEPELLRRRAQLELRLPEPDLNTVRDCLTRARIEAKKQGLAKLERDVILEYQKRFPDSRGSPAQQEPRVFISCRGDVAEDVEVALSFYEELVAAGASPFLGPKNVAESENWVRAVSGALRRCDVFLLLLSETAVVSEMVAAELDLARSLRASRGGKPHILPVRIGFAASELPDHPLQDRLQDLKGTAWGSPDDTPDVVRLLFERIGRHDLARRSPVREPSGWRMLAPKSVPLSMADIPLELPGGIVSARSPYYVVRPSVEDACLREIKKVGALIRIKGPRQTGKTSLMTRLLDHAAQARAQTVAVNLQMVDAAFLGDVNRFLRWLCAIVTRRLKLPADRIDTAWDDIFGAKDNCTAYLEEHILPECKALVLALDHLDRIFESPGTAEELLALLRAWHEMSKSQEPWDRLRLVLVHSTEIYLPMNINRSPFNVGLPVALDEWDEAVVQGLAERHGLSWGQAEVKQLMSVLGGHPHLVRVALYHIAQGMRLDEVLANATTDQGLFADHLKHLLWQVQSRPELCEAARRVLGAEEPVRLSTEVSFKLASLGLVKVEGNEVRPARELYRRYLLERLPAAA